MTNSLGQERESGYEQTWSKLHRVVISPLDWGVSNTNLCSLNAINRRESNVLESLFCRKCQIIHSQLLLCTEAWKRDKSGCRRSPYSRPRAFLVPQICSQHRQFLFCSGSPERIEQMSMLHCYRVQKLTMKYQDKVSWRNLWSSESGVLNILALIASSCCLWVHARAPPRPQTW